MAKRSNIAKERTLIIYIFNGERQQNNKDKAENFKGRVFEKHLSFILRDHQINRDLQLVFPCGSQLPLSTFGSVPLTVVTLHCRVVMLFLCIVLNL